MRALANFRRAEIDQPLNNNNNNNNNNNKVN